jgi:hypothetical protein
VTNPDLFLAEIHSNPTPWPTLSTGQVTATGRIPATSKLAARPKELGPASRTPIEPGTELLGPMNQPETHLPSDEYKEYVEG